MEKLKIYFNVLVTQFMNSGCFSCSDSDKGKRKYINPRTRTECDINTTCECQTTNFYTCYRGSLIFISNNHSFWSPGIIRSWSWIRSPNIFKCTIIVTTRDVDSQHYSSVKIIKNTLLDSGLSFSKFKTLKTYVDVGSQKMPNHQFCLIISLYYTIICYLFKCIPTLRFIDS